MISFDNKAYERNKAAISKVCDMIVQTIISKNNKSDKDKISSILGKIGVIQFILKYDMDLHLFC